MRETREGEKDEGTEPLVNYLIAIVFIRDLNERRSQNRPPPIPTSTGGASSSLLPHEVTSPSSPLSSPLPLATPPTSPSKSRVSLFSYLPTGTC